MIQITLKESDWHIVLDGLDELYEVRCEDADEGGAVRVSDLADEIRKQMEQK